MAKLSLADISDLRAYERERETFRREVIELKRLRRVAVGPHITVVFENATTMRFQVQEMARAERMLSDELIQEELDIYNPLVPGPGELSMTVFIELITPDELREWLPKLVGIERAIGVGIGVGDSVVRVGAAVDEAHAEQLSREEVTASVHYVRVLLNDEQRRRFGDEPVVVSIDHPNYIYEAELAEETVASLVSDWS